ncbi:uncharacterized serine-rich protein C215.13 [Ricinus communis]|uniref:Serine-rich protein n=1 Tax=Ricinus communis TaxID=3988 RepID=B9S1P5_RICCO|nr:uncharacterized serine-rich protein C215.13 [Ricinus communis]EEF42514.1 conserved hypothetical protein [Ricinus communis]|eukprot:XP_002519910.1 uncharacterized serine-rich protein C215.13 [Ricinus communis]
MPISSKPRRSSGPVLPSLSPCGRFSNTTSSYMSLNDVVFSSSSSAFASSTSLSFYSPSNAAFFNHSHDNVRSVSPTRVNLYTTSSPPTFRFSIGSRSSSPNRSIPALTVTNQSNNNKNSKKTCMCSPTTHPGSFRCSLHKNNNSHQGNSLHSYTPNRLNMRRSAMKNSLVRIGGVEGEWVKRALTTLIRPSSHQQRRRCDFQPRPSRLSIMSKAGDDSI